MTTTLRQDIERASRFCEEWFARTGNVSAMWDITPANGEHVFLPNPLGDKDDVAHALRQLLKRLGAVRYIYIGEAWLVANPTPAEMERINREGCKAHPRRIEIVTIWGEDHEAGQIMASRVINRSDGHATLGPLIFDERAEVMQGRLVGMLPPLAKGSA